MRLIIFLLLTIGSTQTWSQDCGVNIQMNSFMGSVNDNPQTVAHSISLSHSSPSSNCDEYNIYFGKGYANNYQRKAYSGLYSINYNLYSTINQGNILKDYGDASGGEFVYLPAPIRNTNYSSSFYVGIPDLDSIFSTSPSGVYTDVIPISFYSKRNNGQLRFQTTRYLTISFNLPRYAELSIVPENSPHDPNSTTYVMNFGQMQQNQEMRADLVVKGNVGYGVMLSSMNGGKLNGSGTTIVPYQIKVGSGAYFTPGISQSTVAQRYSGTSNAGERYNLRVKLGNFANLDDGDYQDVITVTVQAW